MTFGVRMARNNWNSGASIDYEVDSPFYTKSFISWSIDCWKRLSYVQDFQDRSVEILSKNEVIAFWPLYAFRNISGDGSIQLVNFQGRVLGPILKRDRQDKIPVTTLEEALSLALRGLEKLPNQLIIEASLQVSSLQNYRVSHSIDLDAIYVDTSRVYEDIQKTFRTNYKRLIKKYQNEYDINIVDYQKYSGLEDFRRLHAEASGRETRDPKNWKILELSVADGSAFVVEIFSKSRKQLVGAALCHLTESSAMFSSGAYSRKLMALGHPIGHIAQAEIIKYLCQTSVSRYYLDYGALRVLSEKESTILHSKQGFARLKQKEVFSVLTLTL